MRELAQTVLGRGLPFRFQAGGFSMLPFIGDGDVITIAPLDGSRPRRGDVLAFVAPWSGALAVHRLVGWQGDACILRGDNLARGDGLVLADDILGRVIRVEHGGRPRRLGFGPERAAIAWLSRHGWLAPLLAPPAAARRRLAAIRSIARRHGPA